MISFTSFLSPSSIFLDKRVRNIGQDVGGGEGDWSGGNSFQVSERGVTMSKEWVRGTK